MRVAVAGATGALGSLVVEALLRRGVDVRALVRDGAPRAGLEVATVDATVPATLAPALAGIDAVVSTLTVFPREDAIDAVDREGNIALVDAAESAGAQRFVFVSFRPVALDFPLQRAKRAVEQRLEESSLAAVVLRPGKFMDVWFSPVCGFDVAARRATLFGSGDAPVSWIAAADVAEIAAAAALGAAAGIVELGGPEALSQREVVRTFEEETGARWQLEEVPVEELERMHEQGETDVVRSLGAVMLEAHLGAVTDPATFRDLFPLQLTTVREFARRY
ncbi:MAG TPA: NAD(P)H-binding protein [Gaiellaceae bacterium]